MLSWDDLKYFLVMAEQGSLSAAAKKLNISQPTLSRHLTALENAAGASVFIRTRSGLEKTGLGEQMMRYAQDMRDNVHALERVLTGHSTSLSGSVVVSCIESIGADWLVSNTRPFHDQYPGITIDFKLTEVSSNILQREADIAIRLYQPQEKDLVARKTVTMNYGFYASKENIEKHGKPTNPNQLKHHKQIFPHDEILTMLSRDIRHTWRGNAHASFRSNSFSAMTAAVREGYGIGAQSCLQADKDPNLVRVLEDRTIFSADLWLVSHPELRRSASIRAMYDFMGDLLVSNAKGFAGTK
ncbi:MAG: LysR family transcriptional regulator [Kordiimonadaceae bacterium]|nr:LysR family transcriptional regulator [Kordiimonadaceae bacterium]